MVRTAPPLPSPDGPPPLFAAVIDAWLADVERRLDLAPATIVTYRRVARHLSNWGRELSLGRVDLTEYVLERQAAGMATRTVTLELRVAAAAFSWARANRVVSQTAVLHVPRIKVDRNSFVLNHRTPSPSEAARVIAAMARDDWRLAALLMARTGARIGEIVRLRGCDLDEAGQRIAFGAVRGASKTGLRWFPLDEHSLADLRGRSGRGKSGLFDFGSLRAPTQALQRRIARACSDARVSRFTPHGLRRMVVNRLIRARVDPGTAAALTGHSVQVMLMHYQQVTARDARRAATQARLGVLDDGDDEGNRLADRGELRRAKLRY